MGVPSRGVEGSACSGGARGRRRGTTRDRSILAADGRRDGGRGREGEASAPRAAGTSTPPGDSLSSVARSTPSPSVCRFVRCAASCICSAAAGRGAAGVAGASVGARGSDLQTNARMTGRRGRVQADPRGRRRATDRRAAPRRDLGPGAIAGRGRRRAPRGRPIGAPRGKKQKSFALFFRARGDARLPTPSSTRAPRAGAPNPPPPCCVGVPYIACRIARAATIHRSGARCAVNDPATRILLQFQQSRPKAEKKRRYQIANRAADARHPG